MTDKEVIQIALNALWKSFNVEATRGDLLRAIKVLEAALAQPEPEPVASVTVSHYKGLANRDMDYWGNLPDGTYRLYTAPPEKEWVGLPNDEVLERANKFRDPETYLRGVLWAEAKLKEKNT